MFRRQIKRGQNSMFLNISLFQHQSSFLRNGLDRVYLFMNLQSRIISQQCMACILHLFLHNITIFGQSLPILGLFTLFCHVTVVASTKLLIHKCVYSIICQEHLIMHQLLINAKTFGAIPSTTVHA